MRLGLTDEHIHAACKIDPWFLGRDPRHRGDGGEIRAKGLPATAGALRRLKAMGFSDARLAVLAGRSEAEVRRSRRALGVRPVFKRIDTCAAEFASPTAYMYSTYETPFAGAPADEAAPSDTQEGRDPRRRAEPHRPRHRVRLLLLPRRFRAERGRLRDHHGQLQSRDGLDRLRHVRPAVLRAAHRRGRARDHRHRTGERHTARRHRAVRRPDAAQARRGARARRTFRSSAPRPMPSTWPRTATVSSICSTSSASSSQATASPIRSSRPAWSRRISAIRSWCVPPMCSAGARCRSSATRISSATICSARCPSSSRTTSRRAIPTTRRDRSTPCSARTRCCSIAIFPTRPRSMSTASRTARTRSSPASWSTSRRPEFIPAIRLVRFRRTISSRDHRCARPPDPRAGAGTRRSAV